MPSIAEAVAKNQARIAAGGVTGTGVGPQTPEQPLVKPAPYMPPQDMPMGQGLPQRGTFPAANVLASDLSDSNREYRSMGTRSATFPYQPLVNQISKTITQTTVQQSTSSKFTLSVNGTAIPTPNSANLISGTGIVLTVDSSGGITITSTSAGDGLTHGSLPWEIDPSSIIISEDFLATDGTTINPSGTSGPYGAYSWTWTTTTYTQAIKLTAQGALSNGMGGSLSWGCPAAANNGACLFMNSTNSASSGVYAQAAAMPLLENPGWKATWIWKLDGSLSQTSSSTLYSQAHKSIYIGMCSPILGWNSSSNGYTRPLQFIGVRYDTDTTIPTLTLTAAANITETGVIKYTVSPSFPIAVSNGLVGQKFNVTGFTNSNNNVTNASCVYSDTTTLILVGSGTPESHAGTATSQIPTINDSFYTYEAVFNPGVGTNLSTNLGRNNLQGQTSVTTVAPAKGVWHRLDMTCTAKGVVTMTIDGGNSWMVTIPQQTYTLQFSGSTQSASCGLHQNHAVVQGIGIGGNPSNTVNAASQSLPFGGGSVVTLAGFSGGTAALNGTFTLLDCVSGITMWFPDTATDIVTTSTPNNTTVTGFPALTPIFSFGNDAVTSSVADTCRIYCDYFGFVWNVAFGSGGTSSVSKARYF